MFVTRQIEDPLTALPELRISPVGHRDARALLESKGACAPNTVLGFSMVVTVARLGSPTAPAITGDDHGPATVVIAIDAGELRDADVWEVS